MAICVLTGLLTPLGDTPYTYLYKTMKGNTTKSISEHLPLTLINNKEMLVVLTATLALLIFTDKIKRFIHVCRFNIINVYDMKARIYACIARKCCFSNINNTVVYEI